MALRPLLLLFLSLLSVIGGGVQAQPAPAERLAFEAPLGSGPVFRVPVRGPIDNAAVHTVQRALADAEAADASLVVFELDTFGGLLDAADAIRTAILDAPLPTVAFVNRNAASAGALIALAADRIAMAPGASMGAATAVDVTGTYASEKVQSYTRGLMRATAEANGRDPRLAEAMVDERLGVPGVLEPGRLLTVSADEALRLGLSDATIGSTDALVEAIGASDRTQVAHAASPSERALRFLSAPAVAGLLLLLLLGGLYVEFHTPGIGIAGLVALIAAALFFAPHYLLGLAERWELVVILVGVALLALELLVIPGHGVSGVIGAILFFGGLFFALVGNVGFAFPSGMQVARAAATLASVLVLTVLLGFSLGRYLPRSQRFSTLILQPSLTAAEGFTSADTAHDLVGLVGRALTPLRPAGTALFPSGNPRFPGDESERRVDVVTQGQFVPAGGAVEVVSARGARVEVRPVADALSPSA